MRNILDYGAVGDGITVNTKAIQNAIDAGGTVYIPEGVFVTGTLHLKSGGGLYLAPNSVLKASHSYSDYNDPDYCPQNRIFISENMAGTHLISAVEQENVFIAGYGCIDGDSHYWVNDKHNIPNTVFFGHPPKKDNRPGQMIFFAECKNVKVSDVKLLHSPFWHLFFHGCEDVQVSGITVNGETRQWVNDGIDIDCCKRVTVSDCIINTGDDGITLRAVSKNLKYSDGICEDVVVSNCVLTSYVDYGIRIGVGDGIIRNCLFSNIVIKNSLKGVGIINRFSAPSDGVSVENIRFQNMTIDAHTAFDLRTWEYADFPKNDNLKYTKKIFFDGITVYCDRKSMVEGYENSPISNIRFSNIDFNVLEEDPNNERYICRRESDNYIGDIFNIKDASSLVFSNMSFNIDEKSGFTSNIKCTE